MTKITTQKFIVSKILVIIAKTSDRQLLQLLETKFSGLNAGLVDDNRKTTIILQEKPELSLSEKMVLRDITLPEFSVFGDKEFFAVRDQKRVIIPFEKIGYERELVIEFERGFPVDWLRRLLEDILAFHIVGMGFSFFHAACLSETGFEIIVPAWRGTGKTGLLLNWIHKYKLKYKSEDQFFIDKQGGTYIYTDAVHVDYSQVKRFPEYWKKHFSLLFELRELLAKLLLPFFPPINVPFEFIRRAILKVLSPKLFLKLGDLVGEIDVDHHSEKHKIVLLLISAPDLEQVVISPIDVNRMVERVVGGMQFERLDLYPFYYAWVFATGKRNSVIDHIHELETQILRSAFNKAECFEVRIPQSHRQAMSFDTLERYIFTTVVDGHK